MKILIIAVMCLTGGLALADEGDETQTEGPIEELQIRLTTMEQINVTAEKMLVESSEDLDSEIESILLDAEALEVEEAEEVEGVDGTVSVAVGHADRSGRDDDELVAADQAEINIGDFAEVVWSRQAAE